MNTARFDFLIELTKCLSAGSVERRGESSSTETARKRGAAGCTH